MKKDKPLRRKLLKSIAAGGGAVATSKGLPETWSKPLIDAVILPAHAQTTPTTFSDTQASGPLCTVFGSPGPVSPDPTPFVFNWPGLTPNGDGSLRVTANGDLNGNEAGEEWTIDFNGTTVGTVGNTGGTSPSSDTQTFTIPLADLLAASGSATVTATNGGGIDCDSAGFGGATADTQNDVTVRLRFPALS